MSGAVSSNFDGINVGKDPNFISIQAYANTTGLLAGKR